jgi:RNA polymerase sigma-70 factor (ECF subfamily)
MSCLRRNQRACNTDKFDYFSDTPWRCNTESVNVQSLYDAARGGDTTAEQRLFAHLTVRFQVIARLKIGNAHDAEEAVQEALMTIAEEYRQSEIIHSFRAWSYKVFDNKVLHYITSKKRRSGHVTVPLSEEVASSSNLEDNPGLKPRLIDCLAKIRAANQRYARILALHYQGYTHEEVCGRLELSSANLYMILSRARVVLKRCLDTGMIEP